MRSFQLSSNTYEIAVWFPLFVPHSFMSHNKGTLVLIYSISRLFIVKKKSLLNLMLILLKLLSVPCDKNPKIATAALKTNYCINLAVYIAIY